MSHADEAARNAVRCHEEIEKYTAEGYGEETNLIRGLREAEKTWVSVVAYHVFYEYNIRNGRAGGFSLNR